VAARSDEVSAPPLQRAQRAFSVWNRRRKVRLITAFMAARQVRSVLLVGVAGAAEWHENVVEQGVAGQAGWLVVSGLSRTTTEPWPHYVACDGLALPFRTGSFDMVLSNAVIEHVGNEDAQRQMVSEHVRVGRHWVITTPNRAFPVESHTHAVGRHWSRGWRARQSAFTRLLNRRELRALLPAGSHVVGSPWGPTFTAMSGQSPDSEPERRR
jgi:Methyltransferase domain